MASVSGIEPHERAKMQIIRLEGKMVDNRSRKRYRSNIAIPPITLRLVALNEGSRVQMGFGRLN
eukprot:5946602-Pleurochrysis_carterae.AAC.1